MTLPWVRLELGLPRNHKILELLAMWGGEKSFVAYISGLCYAGEQGRHDGHIPESALPFIHATRSNAQQLESAGLWVRNGTGWHIHDWNVHQPSVDEVTRRSMWARHAACKRHHPEGCDCSPKPPPKHP